jgi:hypothetical protein
MGKREQLPVIISHGLTLEQPPGGEICLLGMFDASQRDNPPTQRMRQASR